MVDNGETPSPTLDEKQVAADNNSGDEPAKEQEEAAPPKTMRFWLVFISLCLTSLTTSIDQSILNTALPTVTQEIGGEEHYVWILSSFLLASTVIQPFVGQLANIFGRRMPMLGSLGVFILGSGLAGGANGLGMLLAGRILQGLGTGGIFMLLDIITCDMVSLRERGQYIGIVLSTGALGFTVGPVIGGAIAQANWRWVFYINLPIGGVALVFMACFLSLKHNPEASLGKALARVDWVGGGIFIASITAILLALIMGGTTYPWGSYNVIVPLVLGFVGWGVFHVYEMTSVCKEPSVPPRLFVHRTSFVGFFLSWNLSVLMMWIVVFMPVYFQGVLGTTPLTSGVNNLPTVIFLVPSGIVAGGVMTKIGQYKPFHWLGFALAAIGFGLLSILDVNSSRAAWVCFQIIPAAGLGMLMTTILPAIQASLTDADTASSTAMFSFMRSFGFMWGMTIPAIIFNNVTDKNSFLISDARVRTDIGGGRAYNLVTGSYVHELPPQLQREVIAVFTKGLQTVWQAGIAFCLLGFLVVFAEKRIDLRQQLDTEFGLDDKKKKKKKNREETTNGEENGEDTSSKA